jgi:hypothetical protein
MIVTMGADSAIAAGCGVLLVVWRTVDWVIKYSMKRNGKALVCPLHRDMNDDIKRIDAKLDRLLERFIWKPTIPPA